jgi:hypothetical protein
LQPARLGALNLDHDLFGALSHRGDIVDFQMEHFPDKGFYQHLVSTSLASFLTEQGKVADLGCCLDAPDRNLLQVHAFTPSHFWEKSHEVFVCR